MARSGVGRGLVRPSWVVLVIGGGAALAGLVLAAILPARIDVHTLRCGLEITTNLGIVERSLDRERCPVPTAPLDLSGDASDRR